MRKVFFYISVILYLLALNLYSQTFSNNTVTSIPDNNTSGVYIDINVSGIPPTAILDNVTINISHTWDADLYIYIVDPLNNEHLLCGGRGGSGDNFTNTVFRNDASMSISLGSAPFTGAFIPEEPLPRGVNPNGTWRLHVIDTYSGDVGTVNSWSVTFVAPPCPTVGIHTSPTTGITTMTCRDSIYILPNDSSVAGGAIYPTLYFQFDIGANAAKNAITIYEDGNIIYNKGYGQLDPNVQLTVYFPGPGADPNSNYSIQVCNQDGTAPMPWVVYDGNGTVYASGTTPTGCNTYGTWHPAGILSWSISPTASGLYYASWGLAGFWADESGPGTYTITYNWDNQGTGAYHCSGSASITINVTNPWNASWNSPGTVCASNGPFSLNGYITGNTGGIFSGTGVSSNTFNPTGLSGNIPVTYTVGNSSVCYASQTQNINVIPLATANAGPDASVCAGQSYTIGGASYGGSATGCIWTTSGTGSFVNANTASPTYTPSSADIANGTVTLTMTTTGPCASAIDAMQLTILPLANASFNYGSGSFCKTGTNPTPTIATPGGTFTATPAGLAINSSTGTIDLASSNVGTYTVTYSVGGACPNSSSTTITITNGFDAEFYYNGPFCQNGTNPIPLHTTGSNGTYSATPTGLVFVNNNTGEINLSASQPGTYTVTNFIPASGGCAAASYSSTVVIEQAPLVNAGPDITICSNQTAQITGASFGGSATSVSWTSSGTGTLINSGTITPTYIPSTNDAQIGSVTLTVTTNDPAGVCTSTSDQMIIYINKAAEVNAGNDQIICEGNVVTLTGMISGSTTSYFWTSSGNGTFTNTTSLNSTYIPSQADIQNGYVYITLNGDDPDGNGPCSNVKDSIYVQINRKPTVSIGNDISICQNEQVALTATLGGTASTILWTTTGTGTFINPTIPSTTYIPSQADITNGQVSIIAITNDPDGNGPCSEARDTLVVNIYQSPQIVQVQTTPVTDCNAPNGTITINATTSLPPLLYSIDGGQNFSTHNSYSNLNAGIYNVVVKNAVGCTVSQVVQISNAQGPQIISIEAHNPACYGQTNGQIIVHATGANYYILNSGQPVTDSVFSNLAPGTYTILVMDNGNCQASSQVILTQPSEITVSVYSQDIQCYGLQNGSITIVAQGGTPPYSYIWNNGNSSSSANNLSAGIYVVTITDNNGCNKIVVDTITQPSAMIIMPVTVSPTCYNSNNGQISLNVTGGTAPYTYQWSTGNTSPLITNIGGGTYTVTVIDANGCSLVQTIQLTAPGNLSVESTIIPIKCYGENSGGISLNVTGGTAPYAFNWNNGATTNVLNQLTAGTYIVTITDQNLCTTTQMFNLSEPTELLVAVSSTSVLCNGSNDGSINLTIMGGTSPYNIIWSNGSTQQNLQNLTSGTYSYTVTDANGCTKTQNVVIPGSTTMELSVNFDVSTQQATVNVLGGTPPYTYLWSNNSTDSVIYITNVGTYSVTVTDVNSCTATASYVYDVELKIPDIFTPNGDNVNDRFEIEGIAAYTKVHIQIFNRWGDKLFDFKGTGYEYSNPAKQWNATYNGKEVPMGSYLYIIELNDKEFIKGVVSVVR